MATTNKVRLANISQRQNLSLDMFYVNYAGDVRSAGRETPYIRLRSLKGTA